MKLIDKDALVAEIERRIENCAKQREDMLNVQCHTLADDASARMGELNCIKDFLDTLEVKEVDLDTQIEDYINSHFTEGCDGGMISDWYKVLGGVHYKDLVEIAKHFFELGLKAQKGE